MKCPICGSEIEIAEEMDYEELISRDSSLEAFLFDKPRWKEVYHITTRCAKCRKAMWLNFHKPSFPDMDKMRELAKELFAEKMKESEEDNGTDQEE